MTTEPAAELALTLLSRRDCPLCDELEAALEAWAGERLKLRLEVVDIDGDAALQARYGWRVPVLLKDGQELCAGHFDPAALDALRPA